MSDNLILENRRALRADLGELKLDVHDMKRRITALELAVARMAAAESGDAFNAYKAAMAETEAFFAERKSRADPEAFLRILNRDGGEPPRPDDLLEPIEKDIG